MSSRVRAADEDRQEAADLLAQHVGAGRLSTEEYDERVQKAYGATYLDEIDDVFDDLPGRSGFSGSPFGASSPFGSASPFGAGSSFRTAVTGALAGGTRSGTKPFGGPARGLVRRSPMGMVLAAVVGIAALMMLASIVVGVIAVALHLIVPVLIIMLVIRMFGGRRGGQRGPGQWGWGQRGPGQWGSGQWGSGPRGPGSGGRGFSQHGRRRGW